MWKVAIQDIRRGRGKTYSKITVTALALFNEGSEQFSQLFVVSFRSLYTLITISRKSLKDLKVAWFDNLPY